MNTRLENGEAIVKEGKANLMRGAEGVGGRLHLTDRRLIFESHAFNVQTGVTVISLVNIKSVEKTWTRFLGLIPLAPTSIAVAHAAGETFNFVVNGRDAWIAAIITQKQQ